MITMSMSPNFTGVTISGDYDDLFNLVEALHEITIDEDNEKYFQYINISTRILGLCYDIRHAYQGSRDISLVDNGMIDEKMKWHSLITPTRNVYYSCNCLYPEMVYVMIGLNELVKIRITEISKKNFFYKEVFDKKVIWDDIIATIRCFQAAFNLCMRDVLTPNTYNRWLGVMNNDYLFATQIVQQYIDILNLRFIDMTKEKRQKNLSIIARRITEYPLNDEHEGIKEVVEKAAKKYGCGVEDIGLNDVEYPDQIKW